MINDCAAIEMTVQHMFEGDWLMFSVFSIVKVVFHRFVVFEGDEHRFHRFVVFRIELTMFAIEVSVFIEVSTVS